MKKGGAKALLRFNKLFAYGVPLRLFFLYLTPTVSMDGGCENSSIRNSPMDDCDRCQENLQSAGSLKQSERHLDHPT